MRDRRLAILLVSSLALMSFSTIAADTATGEWLVRGRIISINPNDSSKDVTANGKVVPNTQVSVGDAYTLDIDFTYMFHKNWGAELLLDLSSKHEISSKGSTLSALAPGKIIKSRVLPPSLILQYHPTLHETIHPYVGAGLNYTYFFDNKTTDSLQRGLKGVSGLKLDSSFGVVGQAGVDFDLADNWVFNIDAKYITIETKAQFDSGALGHVSTDVKINPWVIGIGIGKRF